MNSKAYRWCSVPLCTNTAKKTPEKLFIFVPFEKKLRKKWLELGRRNLKGILPTTQLYFCEDHFDLPNDMANYMEYHVMGSVSQIRMKPGCVPSKFECQPDRRKRTSNSNKRTYIAKKQRREVIAEAEQELQIKTTTCSVATEQLELKDQTPGTSAMQKSTTKDVPKMLPRDMKNYMRYRMIGSVPQVHMRPSCVPSNFPWNALTPSHDTTKSKQDSKEENSLNIDTTFQTQIIIEKYAEMWNYDYNDECSSGGSSPVDWSIQKDNESVTVKSEPDSESDEQEVFLECSETVQPVRDDPLHIDIKEEIEVTKEFEEDIKEREAVIVVSFPAPRPRLTEHTVAAAALRPSSPDSALLTAILSPPDPPPPPASFYAVVKRFFADKLQLSLKVPGNVSREDWPMFEATPHAVTDLHLVRFQVIDPIENSKCVRSLYMSGTYKAVIQFEMFMCHKRKAYFCLANTDYEKTKRIDMYEVPYDHDYCKQLTENCRQFWNEHIVNFLS